MWIRQQPYRREEGECGRKCIGKKTRTEIDSRTIVRRVVFISLLLAHFVLGIVTNFAFSESIRRDVESEKFIAAIFDEIRKTWAQIHEITIVSSSKRRTEQRTTISKPNGKSIQLKKIRNEKKNTPNWKVLIMAASWIAARHSHSLPHSRRLKPANYVRVGALFAERNESEPSWAIWSRYPVAWQFMTLSTIAKKYEVNVKQNYIFACGDEVGGSAKSDK